MPVSSKSPGLDVKGDFRVPARADLAMSVRCDGDAEIGEAARVQGDVVASRVVRVGASARVAGEVRAGGGVDWDPAASAGGLASDGPLRLGEHVVALAVEARRGVSPGEGPV